MQDYGAMIRSTFELGSVRDAELLFETIVKNAFPTFTFRRLELIRVQQDTPYLEGRSWNHVFEIRKGELDSFRLGGQLPPRHHGQDPGQASVSGLSDA